VLYFRRLRRRTTWLSLVAMLCAALMPSLAQALGRAAGFDAVQVCTAQGMAWVQTDAPGEGTQPLAHAGPLDHCPYCSLASQWPVLPATAQAWAPPPGPMQAYPERFYRAARTPQAWCSAQPRAPPAFS
jgi:type II secretory pathway pseudopilin PulG